MTCPICASLWFRFYAAALSSKGPGFGTLEAHCTKTAILIWPIQLQNISKLTVPKSILEGIKKMYLLTEKIIFVYIKTDKK